MCHKLMHSKLTYMSVNILYIYDMVANNFWHKVVYWQISTSSNNSIQKHFSNDYICIKITFKVLLIRVWQDTWIVQHKY